MDNQQMLKGLERMRLLIDQSYDAESLNVLFKEEGDRLIVDRTAVRFTSFCIGEIPDTEILVYVMTAGLMNHRKGFISEKDIPRCAIYLSGEDAFFLVNQSENQLHKILDDKPEALFQYIRRGSVAPRSVVKYLLTSLSEWYEPNEDLDETYAVSVMVHTLVHSPKYQELKIQHKTDLQIRAVQYTYSSSDADGDNFIIISPRVANGTRPRKRVAVIYKNHWYLCTDLYLANEIRSLVGRVLAKREWNDEDPKLIQKMLDIPIVPRDDLDRVSEFLWEGLD